MRPSTTRLFEPCAPQEAFDWADGWPLPVGTERVPLAEAAGRVLAEDLAADTDIPAEARSGRDGYALSAADTLGASDYNPLPLQLLMAPRAIGRGFAAPVAEGDPLPPGADAVLSVEQGEALGLVLEAGLGLASGEGVVGAGEECKAGDLLLGAGRRLRPQCLARLASAHLTEIPVRRRPQVRILLAGRFHGDADGPLLAALAGRDGALVEEIRVTADEAALIEALQAPGADLVLVGGGSGNGPGDFAMAALRRCGSVDRDGVAIHPGGGLVLGQSASRPVLLLPVAPLACLCAYDLIGARLLRRFSARPNALPYRRRTVTLARKAPSSIGRLELARLRISGELAEPIAIADGRTLATAVWADGFLLIGEQSEGYPQGTRVHAYLYDDYD